MPASTPRSAAPGDVPPALNSSAAARSTRISSAASSLPYGPDWPDRRAIASSRSWAIRGRPGSNPPAPHRAGAPARHGSGSAGAVRCRAGQAGSPSASMSATPVTSMSVSCFAAVVRVVFSTASLLRLGRGGSTGERLMPQQRGQQAGQDSRAVERQRRLRLELRRGQSSASKSVHITGDGVSAPHCHRSFCLADGRRPPG